MNGGKTMSAVAPKPKAKGAFGLRATPAHPLKPLAAKASMPPGSGEASGNGRIEFRHELPALLS